jgi:hypothetical protein
MALEATDYPGDDLYSTQLDLFGSNNETLNTDEMDHLISLRRHIGDIAGRTDILFKLGQDDIRVGKFCAPPILKVEYKDKVVEYAMFMTYGGEHCGPTIWKRPLNETSFVAPDSENQK